MPRSGFFVSRSSATRKWQVMVSPMQMGARKRVFQPREPMEAT
jgi:hypothetical protein